MQVLVPKDEHLLGKLVQVKITETGKHFMKCTLTKNIVRPDVPLPLKKGQVSGVPQVSYLFIYTYIYDGYLSND